MSIDLIDFLGVLLATGLLRAVPLVVAAVGEAIGERAGLLNLGIEGTMLSGCFFGFWAAYETGSLAIGLLASTGVGLLLGLLFALLTVGLRLDSVLVGLAITVSGTGFTGFLFRDVFGGQNVSAGVDPIRIQVPLLHRIPIIGEAFFDQQLAFYLLWLTVPLAAWLLDATRFGIHVRAVGEAPAAVDASGISVLGVRLRAALIAGAAAGLAGGFLCVADVKIFTTGMTVGSGFIALALAMVGGWRPWRIALGAVLFGMLRALGDGLPILGIELQPELAGMVPYIGVMAALVLLAARTRLPAALGVPYERGSR